MEARNGTEAVMNPSITRSRLQVREVRGVRRAVAVACAVLLAYSAGVVGVVGLAVILNLVVVTALVVAVGYFWRERRRVGQSQDAVETTLAETLLAAAAALILSRWMAGMGVEIYALVFLVVAWAVITASGRTAVATVAALVITEGVSHMLGTATAVAFGPQLVESAVEIDWATLGARWGLVVAFALLTWGLVGRHAARRRKAYDRDVEKERVRLIAEAREFRLIHAGRSESPLDRKEAQELIVRDAVEAVHQTIFVTLELVKTALKAHTVVLFWFDLRNERLKIKELVSDSDDVVEGGIDPAGGVIGGITRRRDVVRLCGLRPGFRGLAYYRQPPGVTEFLGVPIIEKGHLRGVICVDRKASRPFDEEEAQIVEESASYVLRAIENERMVSTIEQTRFEVGRFFEASRRLNGVLTPEEVYEVALESVGEIAPFDFAAITLFDDDMEHHRVVRVSGDGATTPGEWKDIIFDSNQGLASMVVKNRHYLPVGGRLRDRKAVVLTGEQDFSALQSLLVLPLIAQDRPVGTMIIGHHEPNQFPAQRREMLEVVSNQVAVTMQNARLYSQMENMAKYDALTGLANRRSFEERLAETMARHKRSGRTFGMVLTDIDHFKSVNDTYGHPVGDEVLRQVGRTFTELMREIDMPARYGGEEFVMILEDTNLEGARQVANRLREAIGALRFETDQGPLQCTISMGIAMGPWDCDDPHGLVDLADQALYHSKENGRNRVSVYREVITAAA